MAIVCTGSSYSTVLHFLYDATHGIYRLQHADQQDLKPTLHHRQKHGEVIWYLMGSVSILPNTVGHTQRSGGITCIAVYTNTKGDHDITTTYYL